MDVGKFLDRAASALRKRNADQAIALFRQVLVASPGHAEARAGLMGAYRRRVELKGGASLIEKAAAKSLRATAMALRGSKRWAALVKTCDAGLEKVPTEAGLVAMLAEALEQLGHQEEALATWTSLLESDAEDMAALKAAGRLHYELRNIEQAIVCLDRAHAVDRHDPEVERLRKNLAAEGTLASTNYETAKSSRDVIKDKGAMQRAEQDGRRHRTPEQLAGDIDALKERHAQAPDDSDARRDLVSACVAAGRFEEALVAIEAALSRAPSDETLLDSRGDVRLKSNEASARAAAAKGDKAGVKALKEERAELEVEEYGRRVRLRPTDSAARLRLARAHYRCGQTDSAIEHFQASVADPRTKLDSQQGLGACFFRKGLFPLATRQFEAALAGAGGLGTDRGKEICYHLGLVAERMNDRPGALDRYLAVYEVDINYRDVASKIEELNA
jgi:tetratricopeptide (TPR) repeat protein